MIRKNILAIIHGMQYAGSFPAMMLKLIALIWICNNEVFSSEMIPVDIDYIRQFDNSSTVVDHCSPNFCGFCETCLFQNKQYYCLSKNKELSDLKCNNRYFSGNITCVDLTCKLPSAPGTTCKENMTRWYFESVKKICSKFLFSGCDGNDNNFLNEAECKTFCSTVSVRRPTHL